jgi:beta-lactam-binding protein with PASTA domain
LFVSKGPTESSVPDVTSFSRADAIATLRNSGFKVVVDVSDTTDSTLDGVVMTQTPGPGESAKPGATVTITVGHFVEPTTPPPVTTTEPVTTAEAPPPIAPTLPTGTTEP